MRTRAVIHLALYTLDAHREDEFTAWHVQEHVPAMLARHGWQRVLHYRCTDGQPFLSIYELDDDVPTDPHISAAPFRTDLFAARGLRDYHARTWRQIHASGERPSRPEWLNVVTVDVEDAHAEAFSRWYNDVHVPEILACPGWIANRRYECVDGEPRFLAIYDLENDERPFNTPEWERAVGWDEHVEHLRGFHGFRVYRLVHDSAEHA